MSSQTARRPDNKRPNRSNKQQKYTKQTARFEGRRDGKPIIFGWGGHLSHTQKVQLQQRATWATAIIIGLLIIAVIVGFWVNINIITPGLPITSVNGHDIPQSEYRKLVALKAELEQNTLNGPHGLNAQLNNLRKQVADQQKTVNSLKTKVDDLNKQIKALPAGASTQRTDLNNQLTTTQKQLDQANSKYNTLNQQLTNLNNQLQQEKTNYNQSQIGNDSATWLQDDELIREWLATQSSDVQNKINPSSSAVTKAMNDFKANLPKGTTYQSFLSKDSVSDDDMQAMMALKLRRDNMQSYLASKIVSPTYQVLARTMTIDTQANAQKILNQLKSEKPVGSDFGKIAKQKSQDTNTSTKGGDLGWMARGQYAQSYGAAIVENWMFDPSRKLNELSPVLFENGAYHIVQIMGVDPSRDLDKTTLQSLQSNALSNWLLTQRATAKVTPIDQDKLLDSSNMPPDLPLSVPSTGVPGAPSSGLPGQ